MQAQDERHRDSSPVDEPSRTVNLASDVSAGTTVPAPKVIHRALLIRLTSVARLAT